MSRSRIYICLKWAFFIAYMAMLLYVVFFAESMGRLDIAEGYKYNLKLFSEIERYSVYLGRTDSLGRMAALNILGNIVAFMPFGFFVPWLSRNRIRFFMTFFYAFTLSLIIESFQLFFMIGCFDVDDLLLNSSGAVFGYIIYVIIKYIIVLVRKSKKNEAV